MAEIAAGAVAAEEVVSTTAQAAVGTYMIAKPTMPVRAGFRQMATSNDDKTRLSLSRSDHSVTVIDNHAYIFGGTTESGKLAGNEVHSVILAHTEKSEDKPEFDYSVLPAQPDVVSDVDGGAVPAARTKHAACKLNICIAVFGGEDENGKLVDDEPIVWLFTTAKSTWQGLVVAGAGIAPIQRTGAKLFEANNNLILYGGVDADGQKLKDVWHFNYASKAWTPLPSAPVSTTNAAMSEGVLYLISASDHMSSDVHMLDTHDFEGAAWHTISFPTNPIAPGPRPRVGGGLLPISTGYGRNYLLYFFGARQNPHTSEVTSPDETEDPTQWSDMWTFQIASSQPELKATTNIYEAMKPAKIKDAIRSKLGYDSGSHSWAEIDILPPEDLVEGEGKKVHPGPRAWFGSDVTADGKGVIVWGGLSAKGEREGDGWIITFS